MSDISEYEAPAPVITNHNPMSEASSHPPREHVQKKRTKHGASGNQLQSDVADQENNGRAVAPAFNADLVPASFKSSRSVLAPIAQGVVSGGAAAGPTAQSSKRCKNTSTSTAASSSALSVEPTESSAHALAHSGATSSNALVASARRSRAPATAVLADEADAASSHTESSSSSSLLTSDASAAATTSHASPTSISPATINFDASYQKLVAIDCTGLFASVTAAIRKALPLLPPSQPSSADDARLISFLLGDTDSKPNEVALRSFIWNVFQALIVQFKNCFESVKRASERYELFLDNWCVIKSSGETYHWFLDIFLPSVASTTASTSATNAANPLSTPWYVLGAIWETRVYMLILDVVWDCFSEAATIRSDAIVKCESLVEVELNSTLPHVQLCESALRVAGAMLHARCQYYVTLSWQFAVNVVDRLSRHLRELPKEDQSLFLHHYDRGMMRFPVRELLIFCQTTLFRCFYLLTADRISEYGTKAFKTVHLEIAKFHQVQQDWLAVVEQHKLRELADDAFLESFRDSLIIGIVRFQANVFQRRHFKSKKDGGRTSAGAQTNLSGLKALATASAIIMSRSKATQAPGAAAASSNTTSATASTNPASPPNAHATAYTSTMLDLSGEQLDAETWAAIDAILLQTAAYPSTYADDSSMVEEDVEPESLEQNE